LKNGYFKLIDLLKANISQSSIKLKTIVTSINSSNSKGQIIVDTLNSISNTKIQYKADIVLVTVSLGVLKQNYKKLFTPSLPSQKANAIEKLGFGTMNKVFVVFNNTVFKKGEQGFQLFWRNDKSISLPNSDKKWNLTVLNNNLKHANKVFFINIILYILKE
jgi:spermine oxidase